MIHFGFNLRNPWSTRFDNLWNRAYATPFDNKFVELELYRYGHIVSLNFNCTTRQSHAGVDLELGLLGYGIHFTWYDNRHWDNEKKAWENHEENIL